MAEASELPAAKLSSRKKGCGCLAKSLLVVVLIILLGIAVGPMTGSISQAKALATMQYSREIAFGLEEYAKHHNGQYPTGNSSTEIFQKLIDEGYINDPFVFLGGYPHSIGIGEPVPNRLKPENVGFDVTVPVDASSPSNLPVVFLTGYRISYTPGSGAVPLSSMVKDRIPCMAVGYKDGTASYFGIGTLRCRPRGFSNPNAGSIWGPGALSDGTILNFIPSDFNSAGKKYQQLTPAGPLSP